jgi:uncharacterized protein YbjT (DUF2867 family)
MNGKTALLAGASGLIGSQLLPLLLASDRYSKVIVLARKETGTVHPKIESHVIDFDNLQNLGEALKCDDVYCCLGTTMKQAGSKEAFRKVDFDYPLALAHATRKLGAKQYSIVTAMGANRDSSIFYNQVKGEVEDAISAIDFESIHIYRPSLLLGPRRNTRVGEIVGGVLGKLFMVITPKRYRPIKSLKVARAMLSYASREEEGIYFHPSDTLQTYIK